MDEVLSQSAHLVGVCGSGMKALAELLLDRGWLLSGSDLLPPTASIGRLVARGLVFRQGHHVENLPASASRLIYSPAIPISNPERQEAKRRLLRQVSYSQMVGELMRSSQGVCIAGTHGKSTTTAMTAWILKAASRLSGAVIGAELCESGRNGWSGAGDLFVAESCEYQRSFLDFHPRFAAILGMEPDHFDCYPDFRSLQNAFCDFADLIAADGVLLFNADCPVSPLVLGTSTTAARRVSFGTNPSATWSIQDAEEHDGGQTWTLLHHGHSVGQIKLPLYGRHNRLNALAATALCLEIGISLETICGALSTFQGIHRRLEFVGNYDGIVFVDDYAHHPTAVKVTLQALRNHFGTRRIVCVFQPHQVLRTTSLMDEFSGSFGDADQVLIAPVFAARESVTDQPRQVAEQLADRILENGVKAEAFASLDQIVTTLEDATRPGDVIVTMGAGDIDRIHYEFTRRL
ncbi:UDP-N-acetylmuramate--L-alanine ligase [Schlesneria paludicola]|uniref:UDP-N-acetylmuramate--L-alanine ligase n=1 Tax=Schlesneria paludicola TaxID=360056 RepID=UPI00029AF854|nr:UDP-N-acetylmuramate--L-alanine ligase [Schlesneria paludicola]